VRRRRRAATPLGVSRATRPVTTAERCVERNLTQPLLLFITGSHSTFSLAHLYRVVTLLGTARMSVLKVKRGRRSIKPVRSSVVVSTAERLDTFLLIAPSQPVTRRVTTVARRATLPRTAPTRGKIRYVALESSIGALLQMMRPLRRYQKHMLERCQVADNIQNLADGLLHVCGSIKYCFPSS